MGAGAGSGVTDAPDISRQVIRDAGRLSAASLVSGACTLLYFYLAARLLGPAQWGVWQGASLVTRYGLLSHLGAIDGMNRELPLQRGRGDEVEARAVVDVTFTITVIAAAVTAIAVWVGARVLATEPTWNLALQVVALVTALQLLGSFSETVSRAQSRFGVVVHLSVLRGVLSLVGAGLVVVGAFGGFLAGQLLLAGLVAAYAWTRIGRIPRWSLSRPQLRSLLSFGIPITLLGLATLALASVDRILILRYLTEEDLAFYSLGGLVFAPFQVIVSASSAVTYPRMTERVGRTGSGRASRNLLMLPIETFAVGVCFALGVVYVMLPPAVALLLPAYTPGIESTRILLFGLFLLALFSFPTNLLLSLRQQKLLMMLMIGFAGLSLLLVDLALRLGYGIVGVAVASTLAYLANFSGTAYIALRFTDFSPAEAAWHVVRFLGPLATTVLIVVAGERVLTAVGAVPPVSSFVLLALLSAVYVRPLLLIARKFGASLAES